MKRKKIEAWAMVSPAGGFVVNVDRSPVPDGFTEIHLVERDPAAEAVVRAARKCWAKLSSLERAAMLSATGLHARIFLAVKRYEKSRAKR